jgi:hypothetical protein
MLLRRAPLMLLLVAACAATPRGALERARQELASGQARRALASFDDVATRARVSDEERLEALVGAAHACDRLNDADGARLRLERAVERDLPGKIEAVEFELAERLRDRDPARALSLYYRAASGAQKNLNGAFPYHAAMNRIMQHSLNR